MSEDPDELEEVRAALAARLDSCWERLLDAASELCALHDVSLERVLEAVREVYAAEEMRIAGGD